MCVQTVCFGLTDYRFTDYCSRYSTFFIDDPNQYIFVLFFPSYDKIDDLKNTSGSNLLIIRKLT